MPATLGSAVGAYSQPIAAYVLPVVTARRASETRGLDPAPVVSSPDQEPTRRTEFERVSVPAVVVHPEVLVSNDGLAVSTVPAGSTSITSPPTRMSNGSSATSVTHGRPAVVRTSSVVSSASTPTTSLLPSVSALPSTGSLVTPTVHGLPGVQLKVMRSEE